MTTINVTAGHIAKGARQNCNRCPVALAAIAAFPDAVRIAVGTSEIAIADSDRNLIELRLPDAATRFIEAFDDFNHVEPFTFDLDYPAGVTA